MLSIDYQGKLQFQINSLNTKYVKYVKYVRF